MADIKIQFGTNDNGEPVAVGKRFVDKISSLSQTTSDPSSIQYGSLENSGNVVVYDRNGYIKKLIDDEVIQTEGTPVDIVLNGNIVQHHISTDNTYDKNTKQLTMSLGNKIKDWSVLTYKGFPYPKGTVEEAKRTAYEVLYDVMYTLYGSVWTDHSAFDSMLDGFIVWGNADSKTTIKEYLSVVEIEYPYIEAGRTYRDVIDEFCNMLQLQVYVANNEVKFVSARPIIDSTETKIINIPLKNLYSNVDDVVLPKNKYDGVEMTENYAKENVYVNSSLFTISEEVIPVWEGVDFDEEQTVESVSMQYETLVDRVARVDTYYCSGSFSFPKSKNMGLDLVLGVNIELINEGDTLTQHIEQSTISYANDLTYDYAFDYISKSPLYYDAKDTSKEFDMNLIGGLNQRFQELKTKAPKVSVTQGLGTASAKLNDNTSFSFVESEDSYICTYKVLCGSLALSFIDTSTSTKNYGGSVTGHVKQINIEKKLANRLKITVYGTKREISFSSMDASTENIETKKNKVSLSAGNLVQINTVINKEITVADNIKNTIFSDYSKGVPTAHFTVCCGNYYYRDGTIAIDWSKGQILKCEDLITLDNDFDKNGNQRYWKITGVELVYDNEPLLEIDVIQVTPIETLLPAGLYKAGTNEMLYTWEELLSREYITVKKDDNVGNTIIASSTNALNGDLYISGAVDWIGIGAFFNYNKGESNLSAVYLPNSVRGISDKAFVNNDKIIKVKLPLSLNKLGSSAFTQCSSLQNIIIPAGITVIEDGCFSGCYGFSEIEIPFGVERIGRDAFGFCINAKSVYIPDSVTSIGNESLSGLHSVNSIYIPISVVEMLGCPFFGNNNPAFTIYCGASEKPSGWSDEWNLYDQGSSKVFNVKWGYTRQQYEEEIKNL